MSVPYFHILSWIVGRKPFYTKNHLQYLEYFIVYLRSFNDDRKNNKLKRKDGGVIAFAKKSMECYLSVLPSVVSLTNLCHHQEPSEYM